MDAYLTLQTLDGPKVARTTKKNKQEARKWLNRMKYERDQGILPAFDAERVTFGQWLQLWLQDIEGTVSRHTYRDYEGKVRLHLTPALGKIRLKDLTTAHLQNLYRAKSKSGLGWRSVDYIHTTARRALERAEATGMVHRNVARHARPPKREHSERTVISAAQIQLFFKTAREERDRFEALYIVAFTTGLRCGELLGLKWGDLDPERGHLQIRRSMDTQGGPAMEKELKRRASKRYIVLMPEAIEALRLHRQRQREQRLRQGPRWHDHGYIFPSVKGTAMHGNNLRDRNLRPLLAKAGLPPLTFHELRHTFATLQLSIGEHPKIVQSILGHSSITHTMDTYSHVIPGMQEKAAERLRNHLFGK